MGDTVAAIAVAAFTQQHDKDRDTMPATPTSATRHPGPATQAAPPTASTGPCGVNNSADAVYDVVDKFKHANPTWTPGARSAGTSCATLSAVIVTQGNGASALELALMFHKGKYGGFSPPVSSYSFVSLDSRATIDTTVVLNFRATKASCNACTDAVDTPVRFRWMSDTHVVAMLDQPPPLHQDPETPHDVRY